MSNGTKVSDKDLGALRRMSDANRAEAETLNRDSRIGRMLTRTADELDALRDRCEKSGAALIKHLAD